MTRFPRATSLLAVACLAGAACAADDAGTATPTTAPAAAGQVTAPAPTGAPAPDDGAPAPAVVAGLQRWGDGRALGARYDPAADRTLVATTVGVSLLEGGDEPVVLSEGLPVLLALSPDGTRAAFTTVDGTLEIWDLDAVAAVATYEIPADAYATARSSARPTMSSPADRSTSAASRPPEGPRRCWPRRRPTARWDRSRSPPTAPSPSPSTVRGRPCRCGGPVPARPPSTWAWPTGRALVGVVWSPDGRHMVVLHQPPAAGESVAVWDVAAERVRRQRGDPQLRHAGPGGVGRDRIASSSRWPTGWRRSTSVRTRSTPDRSPSSEVSRIDGCGLRRRRASSPAGTGWSAGGRPGRPSSRWRRRRSTSSTSSVPAGVDEILTVDHYGTIRRLDAGGTGEVSTIERYAAGEANSIDVSPDGADVAVATSTGAVHVVRTSDGTVEQELDRPEGSVAAVAYAPVRAAAGDRPRCPDPRRRCGTTPSTSPTWRAAPR